MSEHDIPDTAKWLPKSNASETLGQALYKRCAQSEAMLRHRIAHEISSNVNNFDSGLSVEELVRAEISSYCPQRYGVHAGTVIDAKGQSAGDVDVLVFNDLWFPVVKSAPTDNSRRAFYPIDGVYAVVEIKQSLSPKSLDEGLEKLVKCHRLTRPHTYANRLVENRDHDSCFHGLTNPLFSALIAVDMAKGYNFERLVERFVAINANLKRLEVIRVLCVLGQGCIVWGYHDKDLQFQAAEFMREDLFRPIAPGLLKQRDKPVAWYAFITTLLRHLYSSVLAAEAIGSYGLELPIAVPDNTRHYIDPDTAWMETLDLEWKGDEKIVRAPGEYGALSALHVAENEAIKRQLDAKHKLSKIVTNISEKEKDGKTSRRRKAR